MMRKVLLGTVAAALLSATPALADTRADLLGLADLVEELGPAVVHISTEVERVSSSRRFGDRSPFRTPPREGTGSGFIVSPDGYIVTNNHVINGAQRITVTLDNDRELDAKVVGRDPLTDIALIKVDAGKKLPAVELGDSKAVRVGEWVLALGSPFGLEKSLSVGVISAKGRVIGVGRYDDLIQTDAAINPGNSGGPLFDLKGRVIGINTARVPMGDNIGFAVPIDQVKALLPQLRETGAVVRGWLGVQIQDISADLAEGLGLATNDGAVITSVLDGSPAEKAGLERGDIIVKWNSTKVGKVRELTAAVAATAPDTKAKVIVRRGKKSLARNVTVGTLDAGGVVAKRADPEKEEKYRFGIVVDDLSSRQAREADVSAGVWVEAVQPGSPAHRAGLQPGDVIVEVEKEPIRNAKAFRDVAKNKDRLLVLVKRGDNVLYRVLKAQKGR